MGMWDKALEFSLIEIYCQLAVCTRNFKKLKHFKFVLNKACLIIGKMTICSKFCQFGKKSLGFTRIQAYLTMKRHLLFVLFKWGIPLRFEPWTLVLIDIRLVSIVKDVDGQFGPTGQVPSTTLEKLFSPRLIQLRLIRLSNKFHEVQKARKTMKPNVW